jgi:hypothetical protein
MIDRYGRLFATRGRDNAVVAQLYLQGLTQAARGTFARMAEVVEDGCAQQFQHFKPHYQEPPVWNYRNGRGELLAADGACLARPTDRWCRRARCRQGAAWKRWSEPYCQSAGRP